MARIKVCDRCNGTDGQRDFEAIVLNRFRFGDAKEDEYEFDLCPQCATEFREAYRFVWAKKEENRADLHAVSG